MDDVLAGRYRRERPLGSGGMGDVWLATDLDLGRQVAVKRLRTVTGGLADVEMVERMLREARVLARLDHRSIVTLYDLVRVDGQPHLIMRYVDGESLAERVQRTGCLDWTEVARTTADVADALAAAHRAGVLHRDVKPGNIMIGRDGAVFLTDFGIARAQGDTALTRAGDLVGTVAFLPPEVARGEGATPASDVWSLAATAYAAIEGDAPFALDSPSLASILVRLLNEEAPAPRRAGPMTDLLVRMLRSNPQARPQAGEVAYELRGLLREPGRRSLGPSTADTTIKKSLAPPTVAPAAPTTVPTTVPAFQTEPGAPRRTSSRVMAGAVVAVLLAIGGAVVLASGGADAPEESAAQTAIAAPTEVTSGGPAGAPTTEAPPAGTGPDGSSGPVAGEATLDVALFGEPTRPIVSSDGRRTFVPNEDDGVSDIAVVDNQTGAVRRISVCTDPEEVVAGTTGSILYVQCADSVVKLDTDGAGSVIGRLALPNVGPMRLSADGAILFLPVSREVVAVDTTTMVELGRVEGPAQTRLVHLLDGGRRAVVPDGGSDASGTDGRLTVLDVSDPGQMRRVAEVELGADPTGVQVQADGLYAYVTTTSGLVTVDVGDGRVVSRDSVPPPRSNGLVRTDPATGDLWLPRSNTTVTVYERGTGGGAFIASTMTLGARTGAEVVFATEADAPRTAVVAGRDRVVLVDTMERKVRDRLSLPFTPRYVALAPDGGTVVAVSGGVPAGFGAPQIAIIRLDRP
ncbi:serine/threonine-protein kinase [Nocardioides litoris]|uniref:serine/threonine-protein kinase n=1 Tax=Nocardioides litoris TaxID=1926648 RepID=UPI00111DCE2B|nr:serine/threonine-protein kinase [Nocardioides litoris]